MFLGQEVHYYMVYIAYCTELILQLQLSAKNKAFDAKIVNTRLTKIFMAIFAPHERLPSSATLHAANLIQAECTKSDESPSVTVWNSSHLHISWKNAFRNCEDGHVDRAYVKGSLNFGMALVNFSHGSKTRKISPCSSYPDIRKVIQKDFG